MERCSCEKSGLSVCSVIAILLGIVAGITVGVLVASGTALLSVNLLRIAIVTSVLGIGTVLMGLFASNLIKGCNKFLKCTCKNSKVLFLSSIGTFLASTIGGIVGVTEASTFTTVILALTAALFTVMIVSLICFIYCIIENMCEFEEL